MIVSLPLHEEFGQNIRQEDTPHFTNVFTLRRTHTMNWCKVDCVFLMVSLPPHAEFRTTDHRTHPTLLIIPTFISSKLYKVGCLCLFDFMFSQLDAKHLWLNEHAYEIMYLYKYEGIMATILLLIHFISLWLTLMSLLQPCDDNCIKKNCDSTNSHASERISNTNFAKRVTPGVFSG